MPWRMAPDLYLSSLNILDTAIVKLFLVLLLSAVNHFCICAAQVRRRIENTDV